MSKVDLLLFPMCKFCLGLENHQSGETALFVELQHDGEFLQELARQFRDKMTVWRHLAFNMLPQLHCDHVRVKVDFNSAFLQPHQPVFRDGPIVFAK